MLKQNILIVDDSELSRELLISMLEDKYNLFEACDGREALQMLSADPEFYQLVLLDLQMPRMNGYEVLEYMKKTEELKEVPVVIISADIGHAAELGAVDFFSKPFDREIVRTRIANVLAIYERYVIDSLTGGLNSKGFTRMVENLFKGNVNHQEYKILFFDIDNFKAINEWVGVKNGDRFLRAFYLNLVHASFTPLAVARIEADHFVCLVQQGDSCYPAIEEICKQEFVRNGKVFQIQASCGIYCVHDPSVSVSGMIDRARIAEGFKGDDNQKPYRIYESAMRAAYIDHAELASEVARGIQMEEFKIHFQPIVRVDTGKIVSAEALIRWKHPKKGRVSPAMFIPVLERNGTISKLDMYVLEHVHAFQKERIQKGLYTVPISINLSGMDFYDDEMMERVFALLKAEEVPPWALKFEITETAYGALEPRCRNRIQEIRKYNREVLMDDFGTGYSSFGLLQDCEVDVIKLDMSFVRQLGTNHKTRSIVRAIIDLAHQLGMRVVAEGVELDSQLAYLRECECDYAQGYYFSKPLPEQQFLDALQTETNACNSDDVDNEPVFIPYFYRVGVHYTDKKKQRDAHLNSQAIFEVLKENEAVGTISGLDDEKQTLCYVCDFCLSSLGLTFEELRACGGDSYRALVAEQDRERYDAFREGTMEYTVQLPGNRFVRVRDTRTVVTNQRKERQWASALRVLDKES